MELLAEFLEERNIRFAELIGVFVGGLLIVGSSLALVITFWEQLQQTQQYLKFSIFVVGCAAVFGIGLYAFHRWKLDATGRGILVIATLLVPLDFLGMALMSGGSLDPWPMAVGLVGLAIFIYLVGLAARVLLPENFCLQIVAVVGNSAAVFLTPPLAALAARAVSTDALALAIGAIGALPVAVYSGAVGGYLYRLPKKEEFDSRRSVGLFMFLGTALFALAAALGLLVTEGAKAHGSLAVALQSAAPLFALAAVPVLSAGLAVMRGTERNAYLGGFRTAGTAVALVGVTGMVAALAIAWPWSWGVIAVGLFNAAALVFVAFRWRLPVAHAGAIASAAIVYLMGFLVLSGDLPWQPGAGGGRKILSLLLSGRTGLAMVGLLVVLAAVGEWLARLGRREHAIQYAGGCAVVGLLSLILATHQGLRPLWDGFQGRPTIANAVDPMIVYSFYGLGSLAMAARWMRREWTYFGLALLVGATLWGLRWQAAEVGPLWATILAAEALLMGLGVTLLGRLGGRSVFDAWNALTEPSQKEEAAGRSQAAGGTPTPRPTTYHLPLIEVYRLPLAHAAEAVAALAALLGARTALWNVEPGSLAHPLTAACVAAVFFLSGWGYRSRERTWLASAVVLLGLTHATVVNYPELVGGGYAWRYAIAFLSHATLAVLATTGLQLGVRLRGGERLFEDVRRVLIEPLAGTALVSSVLGLACLSGCFDWSMIRVSAGLFWLAAVWFAIAWRGRLAPLFSAAQVALSAAVVTTTVAWLQQHPGDAAVHGRLLDRLFDPQWLQTYGVGLGLLTLAWIVVRMVLRRRADAQRLLDPPWPSVDWLVGHGVVVGQLLLVAIRVAAAAAAEMGVRLSPEFNPPTGPSDPYGPTAWVLVGVLALTMAVALWHRWRRAELASALLVAATVPYLLAGPFAAEGAAASALRWWLAIGFVLGAAAVWARSALCRACRQVGAAIDVGVEGPRISQGLLLATTALPVLALTIPAAWLHSAGVLDASIQKGLFAALAAVPNASYLPPLALMAAALVGFALRESSPGYAFAAGLVAELCVVLGYVLGVVPPGLPLQTAHWAMIVQLAAITAAVWAGAWVAARPWVSAWREEPGTGRDHPADGARVAGPGRTLMRVQLGIGVLGNAVLLAPALVALACYFPGIHEPARWLRWTAAAGSPWGWMALVSVAAVAAYRQLQLRRPLEKMGTGPEPTGGIRGKTTTGEVPVPIFSAVGLLGMAAMGLLACTVCLAWPDAPEWAYRTLMLGWAGYAVLVVAAAWWAASAGWRVTGGGVQGTLPANHSPPATRFLRAAAGWVTASGLLAVLLGLKAAFLHVGVLGAPHEELLWAAAAIALAGTAGAAMAVWRRREGWAFAAAPAVNLAASLVVWYFQWYYWPEITFARWWVLLVQANVVASAAVALVWLAARRRLYELGDLSVRTSPLLAVQTSLGVVASAVLFAPAAASIVARPEAFPSWIGELAKPSGWLALGLAAAAAAWYLRQVAPQKLFHAVAGLGLGVGVLVMSAAPAWKVLASHDDWPAYHVLMSSWAVMGLVALAIGWLGRWKSRVESAESRARLFSLDAGPSTIDRQECLSSCSRLSTLHFPATLVQSWVSLFGALVLLLAVIHVTADPAGPWWSVGATLAAGLMAGLLATWLRLPLYVWLSGLSINVAGTMLWVTLGERTLLRFLQTNVLSLAVASAVWTVLRLAFPARVPALGVAGREQSFAHAAAQLATVVMAVIVEVFVVCDLTALSHSPLEHWSWIALGATAAATAICLWDRSARLVLPGLYFLGLTGLAMLWDIRALGAKHLCWTVAMELSAFGLVSALAGWRLPKAERVWRALRIPLDGERWPSGWFGPVQAVLAAVCAGLSVWVSIALEFDGTTHVPLGLALGRMAGPLAAAILLAAAIVMAHGSAGILPARENAGRTPALLRWRLGWQHAAVGLGLLVLSEPGWAAVTPAWGDLWLHRSVILMVAAVVMTLVCGLGMPRVLPAENNWVAAARRSTPVLGGLASLMLVATLVQEGVLYASSGAAPMTPAAIAVVGVALAGLIAGCLVFALAPRLEPIGLSERGRTAYVYAAEVLLALVGVHLRFTVPELFNLGIMRDYWMLLVMGLAFAGAGLSELFERRNMPVLSEPLERTAMLVPLAPAIGFFLFYRDDGAWSLAGSSPAVWFLGALLYGILWATKRSTGFGLLAVLAANVGLWVLWPRLGAEWDFSDHPQLYLIPPALCLLVAEYLNHNRLSAAQSAAVRYLALSTIYVSSTAEFLRGLHESVWPTLILIVLALSGVLAGLFLRIRSFLYLGIAFLMVVVVRMIFYAVWERHNTWILWVCCFILGAAIIALFALFEKRREQILAAVKRFKAWQR